MLVDVLPGVKTLDIVEQNSQTKFNVDLSQEADDFS